MFGQGILMILKLLLNTQMIWMILIKTLKKTIQIKNVRKKFKKNCSKKLNPVVTELFIRDRKVNIFFVVFITQSHCAIIMLQKISD